MARDLPPFPALRAFEAAARHESFSAAGEELHVTHGAISRQIAAFEAWLGKPVFHRHGKRVRLTEE
ncbi:LysR family transcriptional regulator, partial [Burkholderia thailandensis]